MAQIATVLQLSVKRSPKLLKILFCSHQDPAEVRVHDLTFRRCHNIIKAAPFMHSQRQRAVLHLIPKGKLHLVSVSLHRGAGFDSLELISFRFHHTVQKGSYLALLDLQLLLIGQALVNAPAAQAKVRALIIRQFQRGTLQDFQCSGLGLSLSSFCDHTLDFLTRHCVLYNHTLTIYHHDPLVGKFYLFYDSFVNVAFFHFICLRFLQFHFFIVSLYHGAAATSSFHIPSASFPCSSHPYENFKPAILS